MKGATPLTDFSEPSPPKNLLFFSLNQEHYMGKFIFTVCYVSVSVKYQQLNLFGELGSKNMVVPKWKYLNPEKMFRTIAASTSQKK